MKKGYTLVELLAVLAIIMILIAAGTAGLLQLRRNMDADQDGKNLVSILKATQTLANDNAIDINDVNNNSSTFINNIYGYLLFFDGSTVKRSICHRLFSDSWGISSLSSCTPNPAEDLQPQNFANISLVPKNFDCNAVLMENVTGKFYFLNITGTTASPSQNQNLCIVEINLKDTNSNYNQLVFNSGISSFDIESN